MAWFELLKVRVFNTRIWIRGNSVALSSSCGGGKHGGPSCHQHPNKLQDDCNSHCSDSNAKTRAEQEQEHKPKATVAKPPNLPESTRTSQLNQQGMGHGEVRLHGLCHHLPEDAEAQPDEGLGFRV